MAGMFVLMFAAQSTLSYSQIPADLHRLSTEPLLSARKSTYQSSGAFNPCVIRRKGVYVMLYRAQDKDGISRIGYAQGKDGTHFTQDAEPLLTPEAEYEEGGGLEDPRVVQIGKTYYLTYTGYNKKDAQLCLATSKDLRHWKREGVIMPARMGNWNVGWTKSGAIVPRKIGGKYWMYYMGDGSNDATDQTGLASSIDLVHWTDATDAPILSRRKDQFDSRVVEPGPSPILTKDGILLIYNGADKDLVYRTGWALFDKNDPAKLLARSATPVFAPTESWEKTGQVPNVVFIEGLVRRGNSYLFYYGAADKSIGVGEFKLAPHRVEPL